jgi:hypothetical protein
MEHDMRRKPSKAASPWTAADAAHRRFVQIACPEPFGDSEAPCSHCGLPLLHHQVRFEVIEYDEDYDSYVLHAVSHGDFDPTLEAALEKRLRLTGGAFERFTECT